MMETSRELCHVEQEGLSFFDAVSVGFLWRGGKEEGPFCYSEEKVYFALEGKKQG